MWIERMLKDKLLKISKTRPALLLTGARQTGKSSLLKREFPDATYITFDFLRQVDAANESPEYFLKQFINQVILDEIQYVHEIFRELKIIIDQNRNHYGKWLLIGSQQFVLMEHISESLAGRLMIMHLETVSALELRNSKIKDIENFLWKGGHPEIWANKEMDISDFFESYIRTYVERDLKQIIDVRNLVDFRRFFKVIASRVGQLINYKSLSSDIGVSDVTIRKWINALQISGLIYLLNPYYANIGKRLIKSPKLYFSDHGLLCHLLGIENIDDWIKHPNKGNLWENFVFMELVKNNQLIPGGNIFFYRDQKGVEIDFIIEHKKSLHLIEAKAGERPDTSKLNFKKVAVLFEKRFKITNTVALNIDENKIIKMKDFYYYNPLLTRLVLHPEN